MSDRNNRTTWIEDFRVRAYEADADGEVHPVVLCDYLQETAANHAFELGVATEHFEKDRLAWVLSRLILEIERLPSWRDNVRVETWPSGVQGIFATRDFLISSRGLPIGRATTAWFLVDLSRRRPTRLPARVTSIQLPDRARALVDDFARIPPVDPDGAATERVAGLSEIDMNGHVNHARYAAWALDALGSAWHATRRLRRLQIQFRAEARLDERLEIRQGAVADDDFASLHLITGPDGAVVAQARTDWLARSART